MEELPTCLPITSSSSAVPAVSQVDGDDHGPTEPKGTATHRWLHAQDGAVQFVMELPAAGGPPPEYITRRVAYDAESREEIADDEFPSGTSWDDVNNEIDLVAIPDGPRDVMVLYEFAVPNGHPHPSTVDHPEAVQWFADFPALDESVTPPRDGSPKKGQGRKGRKERGTG